MVVVVEGDEPVLADVVVKPGPVVQATVTRTMVSKMGKPRLIGARIRATES